MAGKKQTRERMHPLARISLFFYDHIKLTLFLWIAILIAGFSSYTFLLSREGFPPIQFPLGVASGTYFVDDASKVDAKITKPISEALKDVDSIKNIETTAGDNFYSIVATFDDSVASSEEATKILETEINSSGVMPKEAITEYLAIDPALYLNKYDVLVSVYNKDDLSLTELETRAGEVAVELGKTEGIQLAEVEQAFTENVNPATGKKEKRQSSFSRITVRDNNELNTYESITVGLIAADNLDVLDFSEIVNEAVDTIASSSDFEGVGATISADFAPSIETQIDSLQENMITALIVVGVICLVLITWRVSIIISLIVISVMAATFTILLLFGVSLNTITLFGLVLVLGLFVDDATIIAEAIDAERSSKKKPRDIIKHAINKVAPASLAGSLTTVLVFVPLLFIGGILGEFIRILPITIIIALVSSYILSVALLPFLSKYLLLRTKKSTKLNPVAKIEQKISGFLASLPLLIHTNRIRGLLVAFSLFSVSIIFFIASGYYAQKLSFNIFPPSKDSNSLTVEMRFQPGIDITQAETIAEKADKIIIDTVDENLTTTAYIGSNERSANIQLELVPFTDRNTTSVELQEKLESELSAINGVDIRVVQVDAGPPAEEFPFKVQIAGENEKASLAAASAIAETLQNKSIERQNGTTAMITATNIAVDGTINRSDGKRFVEVQAGYDAEDVTALVAATQTEVESIFTAEKLASFGLSEDSLTFDFGQESENQDSFSSLGPVGLGAIGVILLLLILQFKSLLQPLLIFMAIPFSFFGVMYGLYMTNNSISFFVMIGFFGLMGIAVNNSILLTDYANQEREAGKGIVEAMSEAIRKRFRPLITTSLTTIVALLPLALSDPFWEPLAFTILFGLLSSTFLVVVSFPYYYIFLEALKVRFISRLKSISSRS